MSWRRNYSLSTQQKDAQLSAHLDSCDLGWSQDRGKDFAGCLCCAEDSEQKQDMKGIWKKGYQLLLPTNEGFFITAFSALV